MFFWGEEGIVQGYLIGALFSNNFIAIFVYQNTEQVVVYFLYRTSLKVSIVLVVLISVCVLALDNIFLDVVRQFKIAKKLKN